MPRKDLEASSNGRTADFGSAYEGSNPSASARPAARGPGPRGEARTLPVPPRVLLAAVGALPQGLIAEVGRALQEVFGAAASPIPAQVRPDFAFNKDRRQYHSTAVLRRLDATRPRGDAAPVLGVVDLDLFVPDQPFVFCESDRDAGSAIVSIFRLKGNDGHPVPPDRVAHRVRAEAIHAFGHLLGLSHCNDARCAMYLSHTPADSDRKGDGLCGNCRAAVGRP
jgi:archaemetzincin